MRLATPGHRAVAFGTACLAVLRADVAAAEEPPRETATVPAPADETPASGSSTTASDADAVPASSASATPAVVEPPPSPPAIAAPPPTPLRPRNRDYRVGLFDSVFKNMLATVTGWNLLWHGAAVGSTFVLSASGADDEVQRWFWRDNAILGGTVTDIAFIGGWFTPAVIPGAIALTGLAAKDSESASAGVVALQAVGINAVFTQVLKFATGRPLPYENGVPEEDGRLKRTGDGREWFNFGGKGLNFGGIAWPSGHTSSHFALASSLVAFYRHEKWLPFVAYPLATLMGLAMLEGDHHWVSDIVAGGLSGHAIGWTVGKNLRREYDEAHGKPVAGEGAVQVRPVVARDTMMLMVTIDPYALF